MTTLNTGKQQLLLRACIIGSTPLALECTKLIQSQGISVDCVFIDDNDIAFKVWAEQNSACVRSSSCLKDEPISFFSGFDVLFSIVNDVIIPKGILNAIKKYPINYHNGPLPKYAGVNATHWAVLNGEKQHGVTWHIMDEKFDSGAIIEQKIFDVKETDTILHVNLKCREAALSALASICDMLLQGKVNATPHSIDAGTVHYFKSRPSAFCVLPFNLPAKSVFNFFRSCATLGSIPQVNSFGLPKINLPTKPVPLIVKSMRVTDNHSGEIPGTVLEIKDGTVRVATEDKDILIIELTALGSEPYSLAEISGMNIHFNDAHDATSAIYYSSSLAAQYEWKWVKTQRKTKHEPPLCWPFLSNKVSNSNITDELFDHFSVATLDHPLVTTLNNLVPVLSPEIVTLSAFLIYCISLSPTLSGEFDVYCNNLPPHSCKYLLRCVPLALKLTGTKSFQESLTLVSQCLQSEINGKLKDGIRQNIVPADVYLRHPGVIVAPTNVFGIFTGPKSEKAFNLKHDVVLQGVCSHGKRQVFLEVHVNRRVSHKYLFHSVEEHFNMFLRDAIFFIHKPLSHLHVCMESDFKLLQSVLTGEQQDISRTKIHKPIEEKANNFPHVTAVIEQYTNKQSNIYSFSCHTYCSVSQRANDIADALLPYCKCNSNCELRVALLLERTWETIAAMIATLKIGASFVLLEDNHPTNELVHILTSSKADVVLVQQQSLKKLVQLSSEQLLHFKVLPLDLINKSTRNTDFVVSSADSVATIISTSGTTGQRKAVMLKHSSLCNYISSQIKTFKLRGTMLISGIPEVGEYGLANTSFNFDGSIHEIFPILWQGGTLVFHPSGSFGSPQDRKLYPHITFFFVQPAKLSSIFEDCHMKFASLKNLSIGGEAWAFELILPWLTPERKVWNIYGPCEVTVGCTFGEIVNSVHLGCPISNVSLQILNSLKQTVPINVPGELHVGGVGVSLGYSDPQLNTDSFWQDQADKIWYKTGDLVLFDESHQLTFIGRIPKDRQIKLHGIRVELAGIENILRRIPSVKFAHVQVETLSSKLQRLVAYVAPESVDSDAIRKALVRELPSSFVPAIIVSIPFSKIALTKSGKLSANQFRDGSSVLVTHPDTDLENAVLTKYCDVLGAKQHSFGMNSSFVEFGGDSVAAIKLALFLKEHLAANIEASDIIKYPTPSLILGQFENSPLRLEIMSSRTLLKRNRKTKNSLSFFQEAVVSMNTKMLGPSYNFGFLMEVSGNVNGLRLAFALEKAIALLNSSYTPTVTTSKKSRLQFNVTQHDLSHIEYKQAKLVAISEAQVDVLTAINIKVSPTRCSLYYLGQSNYLISVIAHHLVFDKHTWYNFVECIQGLYTQACSYSSPTDYSVFISHQERYYLDKREFLTNFWKNQLNDCSPFVNFPTCFLREYPPVFHGNVVKMCLPPAVHEELTKLIGPASMSSFFLVMYSVLVAKLSKSYSFAIGVTVSLRHALAEHDFDKSLGMLISVIPCKFSHSDFYDCSVNKFVQRVSEWLLNAANCAHFPISKLVEIWIGDQTYNHQIPQFLYNYTSARAFSKFTSLGPDISTNRIHVPTYTSKAELLLDITHTTESCDIQWEYNSTLFTKAVITELAKEYLLLIQSCLTGIYSKSIDLHNPNVSGLSVVTAEIDVESSNNYTAKRIYTGSLQQQFIYSQYQLIPDDQCCAWHSTFTIALSSDIDTGHLLRVLNSFDVLMSVPMSDNGGVYFVKGKFKSIHLYNEDVSSLQEAIAIKHRTWAWPWSFDLNHPLVRCLLVNHHYNGKRELFLVVHQLLFDEEHLVEFVSKLKSCLGLSSIVTSPSDTVNELIKPSGKRMVDLQLDEFFSCKEALPSLSVDHSHLPSYILKPDKVFGKMLLKECHTFTYFATMTCLFSSLLLSKLQSSCHTHFAFLYPINESSYHCNEHILPVCLDIDGEATFSEALEYIESVLSFIKYASTLKGHDYSYWKMQEGVDPFTSLKSPFHEVLVKLSSYSTLHEEVSVQYPRPFLITLSFNYSAMEVTLLSSLSPQQTLELHSCFKCLLSVFNSHKFDNALVSKILLEISNSLRLSVFQSSEVTQLQLLPTQVTKVWNEHANRIAVQCYEPEATIQFPDCIYTYGELENFVKSLQSVITQLLQESTPCLIGILVKGGVCLSMCILASIVTECPFTVLDVNSDTKTLEAKVTSVSISLFLVDTSSLDILTTLVPFLSQKSSYIIVDPYLFSTPYASTIVTTCTPANSDESDNIDFLDTAFVVYTSGSTGNPKPTPVRKKSLVNFLHWFTNEAVNNEPLRWIQFSGHSFDAVVCEVLAQFLCGGSLLVLLNPRLKLDIAFILPLMKRYSIEIVSLVPSILNILIDSQKFSHHELPQFKKVLCTGEKLSKQLCNAFFQCFPPGDSEVQLHNWGGPSECSIAIAHCILNKEPCLEVVPYGCLVNNSTIQVVGLTSHEPVPLGYAGNFIVSGTPVFRGYATEQEISPLLNKDGQTWYSTGDIGYIDSKQNLVFLCRFDTQSKLSGQRVDIDGIKTLVQNLDLPYLVDIILDVTSVQGTNQLVCFPKVLPDSSVTENSVQQDLAMHLPSRFVPIVVKCMEQFPRLDSQKVNMKKLRKICQDTIMKRQLSTQSSNTSTSSAVCPINEDLSKAIRNVHPLRIRMSELQFSEITLDTLGFGSIMKVKLHHNLLEAKYEIPLSLILTAESILDLSNKLSAYKLFSEATISQPSQNGLALQAQSPLYSVSEIALVGMHVEVAGASNIEEFWTQILQGKETITHNLPIDPLTSAELKSTLRYIGSRGILPHTKLFDADLFGISNFDAKFIDPQQRLLLQAVWTALEQAGYDALKFSKNGKVGVFAGAEFPSYLFNLINSTDSEHKQTREQLTWHVLRDNVALKIAREFDCMGPCVTVANNCSTLMVALHLANRSLQQYECDLAIVAAATVSSQSAGYLKGERDIYSADGHCCPFSAEATGTVMSDGIAVLVLRRLPDAENNKDNIFCLIKGTSIGNDGCFLKDKQLVPSSRGQLQVLKQVVKVSNIEPSSIGLIEAHGTGTKMGDQIELESLLGVFNFNSERKIPIGSVKGNIGHTGVAAAGPSIIKAALSIQRGIIPPSINCDNPIENLEKTNLCLSRTVNDWPTGEIKRALVHSVGAMGTNAAAVLEEYDNTCSTTECIFDSPQYYPVCISANCQSSLQELCAKLKKFLHSNTDVNVQEFAYTFLYSRRYLPFRISMVCSTLTELSSCLDLAVDTQNLVQSVSRKIKCTAFSGQGVKFDHRIFLMLSICMPEFKHYVSGCFDVLFEISNHDYRFHNLLERDFASEEYPEWINDIPYQHTFHVIAQVGVYHSLCLLGLETDYVIGHSLGEYSAACVAGAFSKEDLVRIVFKRGCLILKYAQKGRMLSVHASSEMVKNACCDIVNIEISCLNSPMHCTLSGPVESILSAEKKLAITGIRHRQLPMDYAYHHSSMACIQPHYEKILDTIRLKALKKSLISTTQAELITRTVGSILPHSYWIKHLVTPCDFNSACAFLPKDTLCIEICLQPALAHFMAHSNSGLGKKDCISLPLLSQSHEAGSYEKVIMNSLSMIWKSGVDLLLHKLPIFKCSKRLRLPTYPFHTQHHWISANGKVTASKKVPDQQQQSRVGVMKVEDILGTLATFCHPSYPNSLPQDSLSLVALTNRVHDLYGVDITTWISKESTLLEIAECVISYHRNLVSVPRSECASVSDHVQAKLLSPQLNVDKPHIFIINATDKQLYSFVPLAYMLSCAFNVHGLFASTSYFNLSSVEEYAELYWAKIQQMLKILSKSDEIVIGGFSFGAWIAHSIAKRKQNSETRVNMLFAIDPPIFELDSSNREQFATHMFALLTLGLDSVRNFTYCPVEGTVRQYGRRYLEESRLLQNYQNIPSLVHCKSHIFLAKDRIKYSSSYPTHDYWSRWFAEDAYSVVEVPGHHGTCMSSINCHCIANVLLTPDLLQGSTADSSVLNAPVCSVYEVCGDWEMEHIQRKNHLSTTKTTPTVPSCLKLSTKEYIGSYTCMVPLNYEMQSWLSQQEKSFLQKFLISSGTFEVTTDSEPGVTVFHATVSLNACQPFDVAVTLKAQQKKLIMTTDTLIICWKKVTLIIMVIKNYYYC